MTRQQFQYNLECLKLVSLWAVNASVVTGGFFGGVERVGDAVASLSHGDLSGTIRTALEAAAMLYGTDMGYRNLTALEERAHSSILRLSAGG